MPFLTHRLARHALEIDARRLPDEVREVALGCVLDLLTAALAGVRSPAPAAALGVSEWLYGCGPAPAWFTGQKLSLLSALLHNALCASALDLDDGNRAARGHPGASVIPTVLTLASTMPQSRGDEILSAIIAGYDVGVRIAAAQKTEAILTRQTGRWAAFASAAAAGRLLKAMPEHLAQALAIAGVTAPNQRANGSSGYSRMTGNLVKEGIAFSAQLGLQAVFLAGAGFTGPVDLLDHQHFYDRARILDRLGSRFEILDTYFKPYACCRYIHPALDAYGALCRDHGFTVADIDHIEVETFGFALKLANSPDPENLTALQYSLPYCLAVLAILGEEALTPIGPDLLARSELSDFASKVKLSVNAEAEAQFPMKTTAMLTVALRSGALLVSKLTAARGDPSEPMDYKALAAKFRRVSRGVISQVEQDRIINSVVSLSEGDADELMQRLGQKITASLDAGMGSSET
ncbi:MmgE/PrpD family protein [Agrobacterium albertimagni AOL15]|uniref:MmgE/PrpD family protein n=1 Tax=Agrobacterium albertimagni AOL15 TaxID=1156935 RepID=K2QK58_9HYPH|nr:MmgE/PrpD family protein [Agrobacterium albertimagni]EKF61591.1 MmgE/PrpD family protein [Agrobacterium albertimagni AOL15]